MIHCKLCTVVTIVIISLSLAYGFALISIKVDSLQVSIERLAVLVEKNKQDLLDAIKPDRNGSP